jgi:hypothetical protein
MSCAHGTCSRVARRRQRRPPPLPSPRFASVQLKAFLGAREHSRWAAAPRRKNGSGRHNRKKHTRYVQQKN